MKSNGLVSVIIPVYNIEKFLKRCLSSVANSTYNNLEIIIVVDASPDNSLRTITEFSKKDKRVKIVNLVKNVGSYQARVVGLKNMTGNFFTFVDGDDEIAPDFIEKLLMAAIDVHADITMSDGFTVMYPDGHKEQVTIPNLIKSPNTLDKFMNGIAKKQYGWGTTGKLYRVQLYNKSDKYFAAITERINMGDDIIYATIFAYFAESVYRLKGEHGYYYHQNNNSITQCKSADAIVNNASDIAAVISAQETFLRMVGLYDRYSYQLHNFRIWQLGDMVQHVVWQKDDEIAKKNVILHEKDDEIAKKNAELERLMSIKASARHLTGNIKRRICRRK